MMKIRYPAWKIITGNVLSLKGKTNICLFQGIHENGKLTAECMIHNFSTITSINAI